MTFSMQDILQRLTDFLAQQTGFAVQITDARPLSGGASRDTWMFSATVDGEPRQYVLRRDLPTQMFEGALTREQEFRLMDAAHQIGVRLAKVRYLCQDSSVLGSPFFIMDYVPGISIGRKVIQDADLAEARQKLPGQMAEQIALIHSMDIEAHGLDFLPGSQAGMSPAESAVAGIYEMVNQLELKNATWEWTLRWAERHAPRFDNPIFLHGDFRVGNLLVDKDGLSAVIDWEFGHIGDPHEEFGYACMRDWRFGNGALRFSGLCDSETFFQAYEQASGRKVDRAAVDWWEVMGNIRWGVICMSQANRHLSGEEPSVEFASLGRRSAEMQLEALRLIERIGF